MSPLRGEEFTGRSVEEAIERGLRALGKKRTDVEYEVLEKGKPANVLGIGGEDARVLITFVEEDAPPEPEPLIDEAEVPRRPDALREREERREEREDAEREESAPALAEDLDAGVGVLRDLLALMGVDAADHLGDHVAAGGSHRSHPAGYRRLSPTPRGPASRDRWPRCVAREGERAGRHARADARVRAADRAPRGAG